MTRQAITGTAYMIDSANVGEARRRALAQWANRCARLAADAQAKGRKHEARDADRERMNALRLLSHA